MMKITSYLSGTCVVCVTGSRAWPLRELQVPEAAQLGRGGAHPCPPRRPSGSGNCPQQLSPLPLDAPAGSRTCKSRGVDCARLNPSSMPGRKLPFFFQDPSVFGGHLSYYIRFGPG